MSLDPFIGEIMLFAGNYPPQGWRACDGSLLQISQYSALYALLGTTFGGNGQSTFAVPDLRGRVPVGTGQLPGGQTYTAGLAGGAETVTLTVAQLPAHTHDVTGATSDLRDSPAGARFAVATAAAPVSSVSTYAGSANTSLNSAGSTPAGSDQPHNNVQPSLGMRYCIAVTGIFPSRN